MKKNVFLLTLVLSFFNVIQADDHIELAAMEGLQCNYADGKDMDDVMKVIGEWNAYGDKNFGAPYSAWIFTPMYRANSDYDFDFMFLGFTNSFKELGRVQDDFQRGAARIEAKWLSVTECNGQGMNLNVEVRAPKEQWEEGGVGYASISSCSFMEGKGMSDLQENSKLWNSYLDKIGFEGGIWRWWPETGSANSLTHDYWMVASFDSVEQYGEGRDGRFAAMMANTRPEEIHNCDIPRLYKSTNIRLVQPES
ncbi:MAG: hypothetical protein ACJ0HC_00780 [Gammaproteobacteria bacterium]|tara:strand:- start:1739 stop:2494 length:756 start_codon:yes stop_codon:yes gene_type:complete